MAIRGPTTKGGVSAAATMSQMRISLIMADATTPSRPTAGRPNDLHPPTERGPQPDRDRAHDGSGTFDGEAATRSGLATRAGSRAGRSGASTSRSRVGYGARFDVFTRKNANSAPKVT